MSKATKVILVCAAALLLLCCGGGGFLVWTGFNSYKSVSTVVVAKGDELVAAVCKDWEASELVSRGGPGIKRTTLAETAGFLNVWKGEYGAYKSGSGVMTSVRSNAATGSGTTTRAIYTNSAVFEKGNATIEVVFVKQDSGEWLADSFNVRRR